MSQSTDASEKTILGHPAGLFVLFFAELWERFCYYGMRALLALYIAQQFFSHLNGDDAQAQASASYGGFTALVYALGIFGGSIADRVLGYRRSIVMGGLFMAAGEFMLMVPQGSYMGFDQKQVFFFGLSLLIVGNGLFKPNISSLVGKLYKQGDPRRDGGFTIFYMGINIGAAIAPVLCQMVAAAMGTPEIGVKGEPGYVPAESDYRYGFALAGAGMLLGLVCFSAFTKLLGDKGTAPEGKQGLGPVVMVALGGLIVAPGVFMLLALRDNVVGYILYASFAVIIAFLISVGMREEREQKERLFALVLMLILNCVFWMGFEQAGNSLNFFAKKQLDPLSVGTWTMPPEWWQSVNAVLIVLFGPVFSWLWVALDRKGKNPSIPAKFGLGFLGMGLGFLVINQGIGAATSAGLVAWYFLLGLYIVHTLGELCLSPVGLSMVTKLAPGRMTGMVMGAWFISIATGNFLAGEVSTMAAKKAGAAVDALGKVQAYGEVFTLMVYVGIGVGVGVIVLSGLINRWMHGVK
ncbi:MAG: peptide MFS transporter [Planctomycetota bacterium]|nr:peptide MFS transporter [Planctomycetota bacterium]